MEKSCLAGVSLIEVLISLCLINGALLLCLSEAIRRQKIITVYEHQIVVHQTSENQREADHEPYTWG